MNWKRILGQAALPALAAGLFLARPQAGGAAGYAPPAASPAAVGRPAPEFPALAWAQGGPLRLADLRGRIVVVEVFGTWCNPCRMMMSHLKGLADRYGERVQFAGFALERPDSANTRAKLAAWLRQARNRGLEILRPDPDAPQGVRPTYERVDINWPVALADERLAALYPGEGVPRVFLIDAAGDLAWTGHPAELEGPLARLAAGEAPPSPSAPPETPASPAATEPPAALNRPAPELSAQWVQGGPVRLAERRGRPVVVEFWGTWCPVCEATLPHLKQLAGRYGDRADFVGLAVETPDSADTPEKMRAWLAEARTLGVRAPVQNPDTGRLERGRVPVDVDWPIGLADERIQRLYPVAGFPTAFLIGADGRLAWAGHPLELEPLLAALPAAPAGASPAPSASPPESAAEAGE